MSPDTYKTLDIHTPLIESIVLEDQVRELQYARGSITMALTEWLRFLEAITEMNLYFVNNPL